MTTVYETVSVGGTHAMIIGVGVYPNAKSPPAGALKSAPKGFDDIPAAPLGARKFADWLFASEATLAHPLASVEMVLAEAAPTPYATPGVQPVTIDVANRANAEAALQSWLDRCRKDPDGLALFYACGHGVLHQSETNLLLQDLGPRWSASLPLTTLFQGMSTIPIKRRLFLVDCCQEIKNEVTGLVGGLSGIDLIGYSQTDIQAERNNRARSGALIKSAAPGQSSFADANGIGWFTRALLDALTGPAAAKPDNKREWWIDVKDLPEAIAKVSAQLYGVGLDIWREDITGSFRLAEIKTPRVPVAVDCDPDYAGFSAHFALKENDGTVVAQRLPNHEKRWLHQESPRFDMYVAHAQFPNQDHNEAKGDVFVWPPVATVTLKVGRP